MQFKAGDILACYGTDWTSRVIEFWTRGPSHVAVVAPLSPEEPDNLVLFESTSLCKTKCLIQGEFWDGVQAHPIRERIADYRGRVKIWRLVDQWTLCRNEASLLSEILTKYWVGIPYDMGGAMLSGTTVWKWTDLMKSTASQTFCSQLVAAMLQRLCRMGHTNPAVYHPASLLRRLKWEGKYRNLGWYRNVSVDSGD